MTKFKCSSEKSIVLRGIFSLSAAFLAALSLKKWLLNERAATSIPCLFNNSAANMESKPPDNKTSALVFFILKLGVKDFTILYIVKNNGSGTNDTLRADKNPGHKRGIDADIGFLSADYPQ